MTTKNEEGDKRVRVTFITAGKLVAYNMTEEMAAEKNISVGDLVRFSIDRKYEIADVQTLCDVRENADMALLYGSGSKNYASTEDIGGQTFRIVGGSVYDYEDGLLCLSRGDVNRIDISNPQFEYYRGIADAFICVVDGDYITSGTPEDIIRYVDNTSEYSGIFVTTRLGAVRDVVIYQK